MHQEAHDWVARWETHDPYLVVVEFGSQETNWTIAPLFEGTQYTGVDAQPGPRVDVVADASTYWHGDLVFFDTSGQPSGIVDIVVCCELAEHYPFWPLVVANAYRNLKTGGRFIFTAAGPGREEHGVNADDPLHPGWYRNVEPAELATALVAAGFAGIEIDILGHDIRATAIRP